MKYSLMVITLALTACNTMPNGDAGRQVIYGTSTNSLGMSLTFIPAGRYVMGNAASFAEMKALYPEYEEKRLRGLDDESPAHAVNITRPFYIGTHEVTVGQFRKFLARSGYVPESVADGTGAYGYNPDYDPATTKRRDAFEGRNVRYSWQNPGFAQTDDHPVVNVTFNDAQALAKWLTKTEGKVYRLPTEAEWEYVCRAGSGTQYPDGNDKLSLLGSANVFDQDAAINWPAWQGFALPTQDDFAFTAPVGSFRSNAFGVHDMLGNVWEWTNDWHDDNYYAVAPTDDPQGPATGDVRVRRGGSWHTWPLYARCAYRNWNSESTRYTLVGIRLVMDAAK